MNELQRRNVMTIAALKKSQKNANVVFRPNKAGKLYFSCGTIERGAISQSVAEAIHRSNLDPEDKQYQALDGSKFQFAEVSTDNGETWVPCIYSAPQLQDAVAQL